MELTETWQHLLPGSPTLLRWPWLAVLLGALLVGLAIWWTRSFAEARTLAVSYTARMRGLPRYRVLVRRRRWLALLQGTGAVLALGGGLLMVARPAAVATSPVPPPSLDLVVCLDVSPSMLRIDAAVVRAVKDVVRSLPGDRISLSVFNGTSVTKFPLTDDRTYVGEVLDQAEQAFTDRDRSFWRATGLGFRTSQLGEGIISCVQRFDRLEEERGRVVLAVSDNRPFGRPLQTLEDAARRSQAHDVVVHALAAPRLAGHVVREAEFRRLVQQTGGSYALLDDAAAVQQVIARIDAVERGKLAIPDRVVIRDRPQSGVALTTTGVGVLALAWLRRRR